MRIGLANAISAFVHVLALGGLAAVTLDVVDVQFQLATGHVITLQVSLAAEEAYEPPPAIELAATEQRQTLERLDLPDNTALEREQPVTEVSDYLVKVKLPPKEHGPDDQALARTSRTETKPEVPDKPPPLKRRPTAEPRPQEIAAVPLEFAASLVAGADKPDVPPRLLPANPLPSYPPELLAAGIEGTVRLWIIIGADGTVKSAKVLNSSGWRRMDESALTTILRYRFAPARRRGVPVDAEYIWPIPFSLRRS
jgi:protein TonB